MAPRNPTEMTPWPARKARAAGDSRSLAMLARMASAGVFCPGSRVPFPCHPALERPPRVSSGALLLSTRAAVSPTSTRRLQGTSLRCPARQPPPRLHCSRDCASYRRPPLSEIVRNERADAGRKRPRPQRTTFARSFLRPVLEIPSAFLARLRGRSAPPSARARCNTQSRTCSSPRSHDFTRDLSVQRVPQRPAGPDDLCVHGGRSGARPRTRTRNVGNRRTQRHARSPGSTWPQHQQEWPNAHKLGRIGDIDWTVRA